MNGNSCSFNIPLFAEESHTIHVSGKAGGSRRYAREYGQHNHGQIS